MARFEITAVGAEGQYSVKEVLDVAGVASRIAQLEAENLALISGNGVIDAEIVALEIELDSVLLAIEGFLLSDPPDAVSASSQALYSHTVSRSIGKNNFQLKINKLKIEGNYKSIASLNAILNQQNIIHSAVCVDGVDTLTVGQEVGSIDFDRYPADKGAPLKVRIRPGDSAAYNAVRDGITRPARTMGGAELFFNQALMPTAQLYSPRYVAAIVDSVDTGANTIAATAYAESNNHPLTWWEGSTPPRLSDFILNNMPVTYLSCDSAAFLPGDGVVVEYIGGVATVIGFMDDPKPCESGFLAIAEPVDLVTSCLFRCDADYEVDWGDGSFLAYAANVTASAVPTGTITMRSSNSPTSYRFVSDTYESIDVQQSSTITSLSLAHYNLRKMLNLSIADTSGVTNFNLFCYRCVGLTSFPVIDASAGLTFIQSWYQCYGLTSFPAIDFAAGTDFERAWFGCTAMISFSSVNFLAGIDFERAWEDCSGLLSFPVLSIPLATNFERAWASCGGLVTFNNYNFPSGENFYLTFGGCSSLLNLDSFITPSADVFRFTFSGCSSLRVLRGIDTTAASTVTNLFNGCFALSYPDRDSVDQINTGFAYSDPTRPDMPSFWTGGDIYYTSTDTSFAGEEWFVFGDINTSTGLPNADPNIVSVSVAHHDTTFSVGACVLQGGEWLCPIIGGTNGAAVGFTPEDYAYAGSPSYLQGMEFYNWPGMTGKEISGSGIKFVLA